MHNDNNDPSGDYRGDDATTGECPVMFAAAGEPTSLLKALNGTAHDDAVEPPHSPAPAGEETQVSGWLADLEAEIVQLHNRWHQVEHGLGAKDGLIAELKTEIASRDGALADLRLRLEHNGEALKALEHSLADKNDEVTNLSAELARRAATHEQSVASLATRNDQLVAAQTAMTLRIQELEAYIDGRAQSWSGLKAEIAEQKSAIRRLEKGLKTKDIAIDDGARLKRELEQKLIDLERQSSQVSGRRTEREAAYDELQRKLTEHLEVAEQLKADLARRTADHDRLLASAALDRTRLATLEAGAGEKDMALAALEAQLAANRSAADERLRALEQELLQRDAALAQSHQRAQEQSQLATDLKAELDAKRSSVDMLQRSVRRISTLGASVADLERRIESRQSAESHQSAESRRKPESRRNPESRRSAEARKRARAVDESAVSAINVAPTANAEPTELLPIESFLSLGGQGESARNDHAPTLIGSVGGQKMSFPLSKSEMTIGRGKASDIRISSHFISRVHAKISTRGIATTIEDIGSKNGIFVNANRIKRCVLRDGDVVSLASELELKFVDAAH